jgi:capsular exopolysaccharide synthesis family protein
LDVSQEKAAVEDPPNAEGLHAKERPRFNLLERLEQIKADPALASVRTAPGLQDIPVEQVDLERLHRVAFFSDPRGAAADRFRFLRLRLLERQKAVNLRRVLVTSALPQDGKSTVALNLATALAEGGKRAVLLLEADLHHPTLTWQLGFEGRPGLAECLEAGMNPMSAVRRLEPLAWSFLPAGQVCGNPTELLQSGALSGVAAALSAQFDWIVMDSPPVAPLSDVLLLKKEADATLLVVRAGRTPGDAVEQAITLLGREHVAGILLNGVEGVDRLYSKYYRGKA